VVRLVGSFAISLAFLAAAFAKANENAAAKPDLRALMARVEQLLSAQGISVPGYAQSDAPTLAFVSASHPYLQGSDGGFADARVYVNEDAIEACVDLIVVHELVHDATIKHRLFAAVPNAKVKNALEALADAVTEAAADDPYRPGCLPHRRFAYSGQELARLAMAEPAP
jgi:hypothetical protein